MVENDSKPNLLKILIVQKWKCSIYWVWLLNSWDYLLQSSQ